MLKLLIILVLAAAIVGSSAYVFVLKPADTNDGGSDGGGNSTTPDTTSPTISTVTGNTTAFAGHTKEISAEFSDNVAVTSAQLYYRKAGDTSWASTSLLPNGFAFLQIPAGDTASYQYYITVDDAAGNGPVGAPSIDGTSFYTITVQQQNVSLVHNVFVEDGTASWCSNCPSVSKTLEELEGDSSLHFYFISLIEDFGTVAKNRLTNDYNYYGLPTVYVDGGFSVLLGGVPPQSKDNFSNAIKQAQNRDAPTLLLVVNATYDNATNKTATTITVTNYNPSNYVGRLRVFLAERISSEADHDGNPYHHGLVAIIVNENLSIPSGNTFTKTYPIDTTGLDIENLELYGVVFNNTGVTRYSYPDQKNNSFTAYFADACNHTVIVPGGNLPPSVGIVFPAQYSWNIFNRHIIKNYHFKNIICFGRPTIKANASDDSSVARVVFLIDNKTAINVSTAPYQFKWPLLKGGFGLRMHTVTATAYDNTGKKATDSIKLRVIGL